MRCRDQVKAIECEGIQAVALHDALDRAVEAHRLDNLVARRLLDTHCLVDEFVGDVLHLVVGDGIIAFHHFVQRHIHHLHAPALTHGGIFHATGDEPSRRIADDAHPLAVQLVDGIMG